MHYKGYLNDAAKTVFDSSYERGQPFDFTLGQGQVIRGWDAGLVGMCVGEKRKLKIPSAMGYGDAGAPPKIPGGADLVFEVELLEVKEAPPFVSPGMGGAGAFGRGGKRERDFDALNAMTGDL